MSSSPRTSTIDRGIAITSGAYQHIGDLWAKRDWLVERQRHEKARIETVTRVVTGDWQTEWPDLSQTPEAPSVANIVEMGVNHWAAIGGAMLPSVTVPVNVSEDRSQAKRGARKRERRIRELWEKSNLSEKSAMFWGDYAGAGSPIGGVWANFSEPDPAKRDPYIMRFDPRHTYPLKDNLGNITELLVARRIEKGELAAMECGDTFEKSRTEDVEEWFWYTKDRFLHILVDTSKDAKKKNRNVVLVDEENKLGFVPAYELVRPTFDGTRRGIFDQTIHILRTMQRLMLLTIFSTEENAFPAIATYDVQNPGDFGPGAILQMRSAEAKVERIGPSNHFDVKNTLGMLADDARTQSAFPQQLTGNPGASIVSARGINASMGQLDARLALAHKGFEVFFGKLAGMLLAVDEVYCHGDKKIFGDLNDDTPGEAWNPERDVNGAWVAKATYGIGAGSDPQNVETRLAMHFSNRVISLETYRAQLPFLEDPGAEPVKILREAMQDSVIAGVLAQAQQGDPTMAAEALKVLTSDDLDIDSVIQKLIEIVAPQAPEGQGGGALDALQGAESLARGGIPGSAEQAPPGGGLGLPPLGAMMGQDSRQAV
jgi:hypothetical protein